MIHFDLLFAAYFLLFAVYLQAQFGAYSFSRSKDIGVRILKIWASFTILDLTLSGFSQFRSFPGATEYHVEKFVHNLSLYG